MLRIPPQLLIKLNSEAVMPLLALGTYQIKEVGEMRNSLRAAISAGYRHIDTAFAYENEQILGALLKKDILDRGLVKREDLFVTTKLHSSFHRRDRVLTALKAQLKSLNLQYVDLYLIHFPVPFFYNPGDKQLVHVDGKGRVLTDPNVKLEDTWLGMEDCIRSGLARSIGLSNCNAFQIARIKESCSIRPAVNQIEVHPAFQNKALSRFCQDSRIAVAAYAPFASPGTLSAATGLPMSDVKLLENSTLRLIGSKYGKTPAQVILRWLVQRNIAVVAKSTSPSRIAENFQIWDFKLDAADLTAISKLDAYKRVVTTIVPGIDSHPEYPFQHC